LVPSLKTQFKGCRFANRCLRVHNACHQGPVVLQDAGGGQAYRCVLTPAQLRDGTSSIAAREAGDGSYGKRINMDAPPVLQAVEAGCIFHVKQGMFSTAKPLRAVDNISLDLRKGEVVAVVGESGCGKSTLARMLLGLQEPTAGKIMLGGQDIAGLSDMERSRKLQSIFQDPYSSLNPRRTIGEIIRRPLHLHGAGNLTEQRAKVDTIMERVGLPRSFYHNYPNQLSGGQRQRVAIARALILNPEIVICDEPTSALDVSVQAQILNLLLELRAEMGLTYLLITHDMAVVEHIATRVVVMYLGRVVEVADTHTLFSNPRHPYTKALLKSVLTPEPGAGVPSVDLGTAYPNPINPPSGCTFHPRCEFASDICKSKAPVLESLSTTHQSACHMIEKETA
jgi:peptide/nickel transport system ATP-binding protein